MAEQRSLVRQQVPKELVGLRPAGNYTFDELYRLAQVCHESGMWEDTGDAAQAMIKILRGQEMGLPPTTAMAGIDIIMKRLFVKPWIAAALINNCGYGAYRVVTQTEAECVIVFKRRIPGEGWVDCQPVRFTIKEAQDQGLTEKRTREGRVNHWKASPANMLYHRCMGRGAEMYFPELLAGLTVRQEEEVISPELRDGLIAEITGRGERDVIPTNQLQHTPNGLPGDSDIPVSFTLDTLGTDVSNLPLALKPPLHPLWAKIEGQYMAAGRGDDFPKYCAWACRRMLVQDISAIPMADLEGMAQHVFATLEPLVVQRRLELQRAAEKEGAFDLEASAAADRKLAAEEE